MGGGGVWVDWSVCMETCVFACAGVCVCIYMLACGPWTSVHEIHRALCGSICVLLAEGFMCRCVCVCV